MKGILSYDISFIDNGKVYDIIFEKKELCETKDRKQKTPNIPPVEEFKEKEETILEDDCTSEEDTAITIVYDTLKYITFPGITSVYTERDLKYVGEVEEGSGKIKFTSFRESIH